MTVEPDPPAGDSQETSPRVRGEASPPARWRASLGQVARWLVVGATVAVLVQVALDRRAELDDFDLRLRAWWLLVAMPPVLTAAVVLPLGWRQLVVAFGGHLRAGEAVRIWVLAQTTRYLPTGLVAIASRLTLAARAGVPRPVAAASFAIEAGLLVTWSALFGAALIPSSVVALPVRVLVIGAATSGLLGLPWMIPWLIRRAGRAARQIPWLAAVGRGRARAGVLGSAVLLFGLNAVLRTGAAVAVMAAVLPFGFGDVPLVAGAVAVGVVLGLVGVTPAGIGVREGVIAALLAERFGLGQATAAAVVLRAFDFATELVVVGAVVIAGRRSPAGTGPGAPG